MLETDSFLGSLPGREVSILPDDVRRLRCALNFYPVLTEPKLKVFQILLRFNSLVHIQSPVDAFFTLEGNENRAWSDEAVKLSTF